MSHEASAPLCVLPGIEDKVSVKVLIDDLPHHVKHCLLAPNCEKRHPMQSFDVYDGVAFITYDGGYCITYDLDSGEKLSEFALGCHISHTHHCGNAMFGTEKYDPSDRFPLFYSSGDLTTKACYVERILTDESGKPIGAKLLQWITFDMGEAAGENGAQIIVDPENDRLIFQQRKFRNIGQIDNIFVMGDYPFPKHTEGVYSEEKDCLVVNFPESARTALYELPYFAPVYQGADYIENRILQSYGNKQNPYGSTNGVMVYENDAAHTLSRYIFMEPLVGHYEPQSVVVSDGRLFMNYFSATAPCLYELFVELGITQTTFSANEKGIEAALNAAKEAIAAQLASGGKGYTVASAEMISVNTDRTEIDVTVKTPYTLQKVRVQIV